MVDVVDHPHSLVLEFLDKSLYEASCERRLERHDIKRAIRTVLDALAFLHAHKRAHTGQKWASSPWTDGRCITDIKPNNILANNGTGTARFGTIELGDFGDSVPWEIATNNGHHIMSAPIYRAPEVMLNARWTAAVDIWSLGATVSP
jgi:casein kinase II subunit alpha